MERELFGSKQGCNFHQLESLGRALCGPPQLHIPGCWHQSRVGCDCRNLETSQPTAASGTSLPWHSQSIVQIRLHSGGKSFLPSSNLGWVGTSH